MEQAGGADCGEASEQRGAACAAAPHASTLLLGMQGIETSATRAAVTLKEIAPAVQAPRNEFSSRRIASQSCIGLTG